MDLFLTSEQIYLAAHILSTMRAALCVPETTAQSRRIEGLPLGELVIPAHLEDGWVAVPLRTYKVSYHHNYGVCSRLCSSNGAILDIVRCVYPGSGARFEPLYAVANTEIADAAMHWVSLWWTRELQRLEFWEHWER